MKKQDRFALLIDAENISRKYIKLIMDELNEFGIPTYKRIYGDFTSSGVAAWKDVLRTYALTPILQYGYTKGKNSSDSAMIIDAMDILYSGNVNGFCLVTSDSDFTRLANRLREAGMLVVGMGEQKTPGSLVAACEHFKYLDLLLKEEETEEEENKKIQQEIQPTKKNGDKNKNENSGKALGEEEKREEAEVSVSEAFSIPTKEKIGEEIKSIIHQVSDDNGWVNQSEIGVMLSKRVPGFDPRNYKYSKLSQLITSYKFLETNTVPNPKNELLKIIYVKIKE
ncbi:MAG: NYN domain-containing protein [Lachnospiraceae bacterium]|nr:NYN domain-containing protein [Lachnospiraceae bacterium]